MLSDHIYQEIAPTYLYIKQHTVTGLLYFGKTTRNPHKYLGSGKHWKRHLKKHGKKFVKTLFVSEPFVDARLISSVAVAFSAEVKIVESPEWANMVVENGLDGGSNTKGRTTLRNKATGECICMSVDDPRHQSGDFEGVNSGNKNKGNNKGKMTAKFADSGIVVQVDVDDPRRNDGTLVGVTKGISYTHKKPRSSIHCANISKAKKGKPSSKKGIAQPTKICPHCGKQGGQSSMHRWHFDNCKFKSSQSCQMH